MRRTAAATLVLMALLSTAGHAQPTQPIYVFYDGFVKNPNGTLTLAFGYANLNRPDITIATGPRNSFTAAPADRNQPVKFVSGRHRFSCVLVVPKGFDGHLQWSLEWAGHTSTTTAKLLEPLYELEELSRKRATSGLDLDSTQFGVCINRPPIVELGGLGGGALIRTELNARVDEDVVVNASVDDDGLPRGGQLKMSWKALSGPGSTVFSNPTSSTTRARFSAAGEYEIELSASDGEQSGSTTIRVSVRP